MALCRTIFTKVCIEPSTAQSLSIKESRKGKRGEEGEKGKEEKKGRKGEEEEKKREGMEKRRRREEK